MRTCCVVLPLAPMRVGDRIDRRAWAPHITLAEGDIAGAQLDVISEFLSARPFATPVPLSGLCLLDGEAGGRPLRNVPLGRVTSL